MLKLKAVKLLVKIVYSNTEHSSACLYICMCESVRISLYMLVYVYECLYVSLCMKE